jgi:hypothetical protein
MEQPVVKFYKLRDGENIVAFEMENADTHYRLRRPLSFTIENEVMSGRQMLNVREWIPPIVCATDEICIPKEYVMVSTDVKESFKSEYEQASEFLYNVQARPKKPREEVPVMLKDPSRKPN